MRRKLYKCPNGCKLPPRKKTICKNRDQTYCFAYRDFPFCPVCGSLMPISLERLKGFFEVYHIHPLLQNSVDLIYKSEFESAAREAFVTVENVLRNKSKLESHGFDLATKALSFECDKKTGEVIKRPLIAINELKNDSDKNEQEGIRYMLMGFFQGPRNLYQHNHIGSGASNSISIVIEASFFLHLLDGHSLTKNGQWIPVKVNYRDIYERMPSRIDKWRLKRMLKRRDKAKRRNEQVEQERIVTELAEELEETIAKIKHLK